MRLVHWMVSNLACLSMGVSVLTFAQIPNENPVQVGVYASGDHFYLDPDSIRKESQGVLLYKVWSDHVGDFDDVDPDNAGRMVTLNRINCQTGLYQSYLEAWVFDAQGQIIQHRTFAPRPHGLTKTTALYSALKQACMTYFGDTNW